MAIALLYHEELKEYDFGPGHPFRGDRFQIFPRFLTECVKYDDNYRFLKAEPATDSHLPETKRVVTEMKRYLKSYWKNL